MHIVRVCLEKQNDYNSCASSYIASVHGTAALHQTVQGATAPRPTVQGTTASHPTAQETTAAHPTV